MKGLWTRLVITHGPGAHRTPWHDERVKVVNHHAGCCGFNPVRPDGTQWGHVLGLPGGGSVHADSPAEILAELIPGYANLQDESARRRARESHAREVGGRHQQHRIDAAVADGLVDPEDPDDAALIGLLREVACRPIALARADENTADDPGASGPRDGPSWGGAVRLVCLTTAYAPYGELPPPAGQVDWIDPVEEERYLVSLRRIGALDYWSEAVSAD